MFKSILVPSIGFSNDSGALQLAHLFARLFDSHLDCLHVRQDPVDLVSTASGYGVPLGTQMIVTDLIEVLQEADAKRSERSKKTYENFCTRESLCSDGVQHKTHGPSASWMEKTGREGVVLTAVTRVHDLVVLGNVGGGLGLASSLAGDILLGGGRPVVLATDKVPDSFDTILIAWKDTAESARAVSASMPLLARANRVVIVQVAENKDTTSASSKALAESLRWHDIDVEVIFLAQTESSVFDSVMMTADVVNADLLVMGGYGRSRIGEFIFGGLTQSVLAAPKLPVFLCH